MGLYESCVIFLDKTVLQPMFALGKLFLSFARFSYDKMVERVRVEKKTCFAKLVLIFVYLIANFMISLIQMVLVIRNGVVQKSMMAIFFLILLENVVLVIQFYSDLYSILLFIGMEGFIGAYVILLIFQFFKTQNAELLFYIGAGTVFFFVNFVLMMLSLIQVRKASRSNRHRRLQEELDNATAGMNSDSDTFLSSNDDENGSSQEVVSANSQDEIELPAQDELENFTL